MRTAKFIMGAIALAVVSMLAAPVANAAQDNKDAEGNTIRHPYLTNGLWDNWFVGAGAGLNFFYDNAEKNTGFALDVNVGKWVTPSFGVRLGYNGLKGSLEEKGSFSYIHGDAMWNISNAIGGYSETRLWNFVPYAHAGMLIDSPMTANELAVGFGLLNVIQVSKRLDVTLDVRNTTYRREKVAGFLTAAVGVSVNLGRTDWTRASEYHNPTDLDKISAAEAAAAALTAANAALAADKAKLQKENGALEDENAKLADELKKALAEAGLKEVGPASFFFEIGKTELSAKELKHLDFYLANVLPNVKNAKATVITGTADSNTGYAKRNEYLSQKRAEYMINLLKEKGVDTEKFIVKNSVVKSAKGEAAFDRAVVVSFE